MEGTKPRTVSSLGMFDLLKGIGMLAIVFAHTAELYPLGTNDVTPFAFALFAYREALMAAFFIASGYGFRKRSIHKCIEQQLKTLLKPYLYTALATTVLHAFIHHAAFGSWDAAISESAKVLGGFLLGLPHTATYFGQQFFSCGPMWYLVALMLAWVLLDVLLEIFPERYITPRSRRRHPAWLGRHTGVGGSLLHRTGHGVAALPLHRLSGQEAPSF